MLKMATQSLDTLLLGNSKSKHPDKSEPYSAIKIWFKGGYLPWFRQLVQGSSPGSTRRSRRRRWGFHPKSMLGNRVLFKLLVTCRYVEFALVKIVSLGISSLQNDSLHIAAGGKSRQQEEQSGILKKKWRFHLASCKQTYALQLKK